MATTRFWKKTGITIAIGLCLVLVAYLIVSWWSSRRLEARLVKLRAAGEPTSMSELASEQVPVEENAALVLKEVRPQIEAFSKAQAAFHKTPDGKAYAASAYKNADATEGQIDAIRGTLAMYPEVSTAVERAAECHYHAWPYDYSVDHGQFLDEMLHSMTLSRAVSRFCSWQIAVALADGDFDEAAQIGINMFKLARLRDAEPTINNGLVGLALRNAAVRDLNRVLRLGQISPEMRSRLDQELALHDDPLWLVKVMKIERAYNLDASLGASFAFPSIQGRAAQADILDVYEDLLPLLAKPWHETKGGKINAVFIRQSPIPILNALPVSGSQAQLLLPGMQAANEAFHRTVATMRCLRVLNAMQAYEEKGGREAQSLIDLELPESSLIDPFSGQLLMAKKAEGGWVIYSVYQNGKDDDGEFESRNDEGITPIGYPGAH